MHHGAVNPSPVGDRTLLCLLWYEGLAVAVDETLKTLAVRRGPLEAQD
jgi:hypothetical protein